MAARGARLQRSDLGAWLLTCNPRKWDIEGYRASGKTSIHSWAVSGYRSELMQRNDLVFLWVTGSRHPGPTPGLRGIGRIAGPAAWRVSDSSDPNDGEQFWIDPQRAARKRLQVPMNLDIWPDAIPRIEIQADPRLATMEVIRTDASGRNPFFVTAAETDILLQLAGGAPPVLTGVPDQEITVGDRGAGYGDPLTNKAVELAAMRAVVNLYENEGWICEDVSSQQLGWDITVRRDGQERHVEVKGVGGDRPSILLTRHEYETARTDAQWKLIVVTAALQPLPQIWQYPPEQAVSAADPYVYRLQLDRNAGTAELKPASD